MGHMNSNNTKKQILTYTKQAPNPNQNKRQTKTSAKPKQAPNRKQPPNQSLVRPLTTHCDGALLLLMSGFVLNLCVLSYSFFIIHCIN